MPYSSKVSRRRFRTLDPLANPAAVKSILSDIREETPVEILNSPKLFNQLLLAVRHQETYNSKNSKRGRPRKFSKEILGRVSKKLKSSLAKKTNDRVSLRTFVDHYLKILDFPEDVLEPLVSGSINLFEAEQLARLTTKNLDITLRQAKQKRIDLLNVHLAVQESGSRLRLRVNEILGLNQTHETIAPKLPNQITSAPEIQKDFSEVDSDPSHLFYDQINQLVILLSTTKAEDISNDALEEVLQLTDEILTLINTARKNKRPKLIFET